LTNSRIRDIIINGRIKGAKINEPWATDGKASADMIDITQVFDTKTGEDVTDEFRRELWK
jgi:hypothetical protein